MSKPSNWLRGLAAGVAVTASVAVFAPVFAGSSSDAARVTEVAERGQQRVVRAPGHARYRVTIDYNWTSETHPGTVPEGNHFSEGVWALSFSDDEVFRLGSPAGSALEQLAETGDPEPLLKSFDLPTTLNPADFGSLPATANGLGTASFEVWVSQSYSKLSIVSRLAPSSDWFVGTRNTSLFVDGDWLRDVTFDARNFDAGTRDGDDFAVGGETTPPGVVSAPVEPGHIAAADEGPFATITVELLQLRA